MPIHGYTGNVITANPTAPTVSVATGVWTTEQQLQAIAAGNWPGYEYPVTQSLRFNSADSAYLNRTPASASNRRTWTWSGWVKRSALGSEQMIFEGGTYSVGPATEQLRLFFTSGDALEFNEFSSSAYQFRYVTTQLFRDVSAWYHIIAVLDTVNSIGKLYVNGTQVTAFSTSTAPALNFQGKVNSVVVHSIGRREGIGTYLSGYLTEVNFVDGQALTPSSFGLNDPETGVWSPKRYTGTYGTNGFYLPMQTSSNWSGFFDGTGDYVNVSGTGAAINFGTSDFTIETWAYITSLATNFNILDTCPNGNATPTNRILIRVLSNGTLQYATYQAITILIASSASAVTTNSWNHVALVKSSGSTKLYLNGTQVGSTYADSLNYPLQTNRPLLAGDAYNSTSLGTGYLSNLRIVKGTAVYTANFTPPTSQLTAITNTSLLTCQSSTFIDNSPNNYTITVAGDSRTQQFSPFIPDVTDDQSGNNNNWNPNNLNLITAGVGADILVDSPTAYGTDTGAGGTVRGNYCTWNPLVKFSYSPSYAGTYSNGNLDVATGGNPTQFAGTMGLFDGCYWEVTAVSIDASRSYIGLAATQSNLFSSSSAVAYNGTYAVLYSNDGFVYVNTTSGSTSYGSFATWTNNDVISVAFKDGKIYFAKNGTWINSGVPASGTGFVASGWNAYGTLLPYAGYNSNYTGNFGQRAFAYTAPSGFKALCTTNLPTPTIGATSTTQANDYFNPVLYTGTGSSLSVTGVGFQPDFTWIKGRSGATDHGLYDAVRGVQKQLESNTTTAETTETTGLTAFGSDGFTVGALAQLNTSTATYVAWNWNAGGSNATNTSGTITSTVRANTTSGFSIVTYTGTGSAATIGHGLGVAPRMVIVKWRTGGSTQSWAVYHASSGATKYLALNTTAAEASATSVWNDTAPTSSVFSVGNDNWTNASTWTYVAYCFAPVAGYSAFGSYTGNGSADGPFVYLGFRPEFVMIKRTSAADNWVILDAVRSTANPTDEYLWANLSNAEVANLHAFDFLSNGFKIRNSTSDHNTNGSTYIYACFAESPFKYALAR